MRHPLFLSIVLLLAAALSWWLSGNDTPLKTNTERQGAREVDYYLRGLNVTTMGMDGTPARTLRAAEVKHFDNDDTTELSQAKLIIHQADQPPWQIMADSGWVSSDGSLILLNGKVKIDRMAAPGVRPFHLTTQNLRIQPHEDYAETDEKVRVHSYNDHLQATGMQAWLRRPSRIKFLADVKGFYAPP